MKRRIVNDIMTKEDLFAQYPLGHREQRENHKKL